MGKRTICPNVFTVLLLIGFAPVLAADPSAEDVLKAKGLTKFGVFYVVGYDANLPNTVRSLKAAEAKYQDSVKRRSNLERDIRTARAALEDLADRNAVETNRLEHTSKSAYASYNRQVDIVNGIRAKLREGLKFLEQRQKALEVLDGQADPAEEYASALQKASLGFDGANRVYATLATDPEVTAALEQLNKTAKPPARLGPSEAFKSESLRVARLAKTFVSGTINFAIIGGVPHVPVTLNDSIKTEMVVDSGAGMVLLTTETAKQLGLDKPQANEHVEKFVTADGTVREGRVVVVPKMRLGAFTVENVEASILPKDLKGGENLLGGTFLRHFVYKMDLAGGFLRLTQIPDTEMAKAPATAPAGTSAGKPKDELDVIQVEAYIDGTSNLCVTRKGLYWKNMGADKPGLHSGHHDPTYVNGAAWTPVWGTPDKVRGKDTSDSYALAIGSRQYDVELVTISNERGGKAVEKDRGTYTFDVQNGEQILAISDPGTGARWYTFRLTLRKAGN